MHLILINLIVSDLAIIFIGIPVDALGAFTKGYALDVFLCQSVAFVHTMFGSYKSIKNAKLSAIAISICFIIYHFDRKFDSTNSNSKFLLVLRNELFVYPYCYGCDTIHIYHMARAVMAFAYPCNIHNLKIRTNDLDICVCSSRTTGYWIRDICC